MKNYRLIMGALMLSCLLYAAEPENIERENIAKPQGENIERDVDVRAVEAQRVNNDVLKDHDVSTMSSPEGTVSVADSQPISDTESTGLDVGSEKDEYKRQYEALLDKQIKEFEKAPTNMIFARAASWSIGSAKRVIGAKEEDINGMRFPILADKPFVTKSLEEPYGALVDAFNALEQASTANYDVDGGRVLIREHASFVAAARVRMMEQYSSVLDDIYKSAEGLDSSSRQLLKDVKKWIRDGEYEKATTASPEMLKILAASGSKGGSLILSQMMMMDETLSRAARELNARVNPSVEDVNAQAAEYEKMKTGDLYKMSLEENGQVSIFEIGQGDDLEELLTLVEADRPLLQEKRSLGRSASGNAYATYDALLSGTRVLVDVASDHYVRSDYGRVRANRLVLERERANMLQKYADALQYLAKKQSFSKKFGSRSEFSNYVKTVRGLIAQGRYAEIAEYESDVVNRMLAGSTSKKAALIVSQMRVVSKSMDYAIEDLQSLERTMKPLSDKEKIDIAIRNRDRHLYDDAASPPPSPAGGYSSPQRQSGDVAISTDQFVL